MGVVHLLFYFPTLAKGRDKPCPYNPFNSNLPSCNSINIKHLM
jgi:hypothetical protein